MFFDHHTIKTPQRFGSRSKRILSKILSVLFFAALLSFFLPRNVSALTLSLDSSATRYGPGDTFVVTVRADNVGADECFNAADLVVLYPADLVDVVAVSKGESLFTLWAEEPAIDRKNGRVRIAGGIPAGYCGRVLGDPGRTNILAKIIMSIPGFQIGGRPVTEETPVTITFAPETAVLQNDGFGTPISYATKKLTLTRLLESSGIGNAWTAEVHEDLIPPESFVPLVQKDPQTFGGKYFLVFSTVDKQSGLDHFDVVEEDPLHPGYVRRTNYDRTIPLSVTSPYVLKDQDLHSTIIVTAYDNAGNQRRAEIPPPLGTSTALFSDKGIRFSRDLWGWIIAGICLFGITGSIFYLFVRRHKEDAEIPESLHHDPLSTL